MNRNVVGSREVAARDVPLPGTALRPRLGGARVRGSTFTFFGQGAAAGRARRLRSILRVAALSGSSFVTLNGCSLDTRQLSSELNGGQAGAESTPLIYGGGGTAGEVGASSEHAGSAGWGEQLPLVAGCPDLDGNSIGDCTETLVQNGDFKLDVGSWSPEPQTKIDWDDMNAAADLPSGSALVTGTNPASPGASGFSQHVAKQCLALSGKQLVTIYGNAFIDGGQAAGGYAEIDLSFFDTPACAGSYMSTFSTPQPLDASKDEWVTLKGGSVSSTSTQSVSVALTVYQPLSQASFSARFDNILLRKQAP